MLRQKANAGGNASVSMNLNVPGIPKTNALLTRFFELCKEQLTNWLLANRIFIDEKNETTIQHAAGNFYIVAIKPGIIQVSQLKQSTELFEIDHPLGRFIDVDVTDENGKLFSSGKSKPCFYCQLHPASDCIQSHRHPVETLRDFQLRQIEMYLREERLLRLSRKVSSLAIRSVLYELSLTPKPGLVDTAGSGIHTDMDYRTFVDSTAAISGWFTDLFRAGTTCRDEDLKNALPHVRNMGLRMEKEMFQTTNGINTQKGIIFLMGISLFGAGYVLKENDMFDQHEFITTIKTLCNNLVETEFVNHADTLTHGELCFRKYHTGGVRSEAENGFPTIFGHSLPVLERENNTGSVALYKTLLSVMAVLNDTNILYRSDRPTLETLQNLSKKALDDFSMEAYAEIADFCKANKISPGGSADLLSITIFIFLLKNEL